MARGDAMSAAVLALVALFALVLSARMEMQHATHPGPGFFPLVVSAALLLVSLALGVRAWRLSPSPDAVESSSPPRVLTLAGTVVALAVYITAFDRVGFVLSTTALLAFLFGALGRYRWPVALGIAVAVALAARLVFDTWLQVRLPADLWGR
jgi:putative tricarboxylic transport membrane protein